MSQPILFVIAVLLFYHPQRKCCRSRLFRG